MPEPFAVLLDQNVPQAVAAWLQGLKPSWEICHTTTVGLGGKSDREVFDWAQAQRAIIITFDEDFSDQRSFPVGGHHVLFGFGCGPQRSRRLKRRWNACWGRFPTVNCQVHW